MGLETNLSMNGTGILGKVKLMFHNQVHLFNCILLSLFKLQFNNIVRKLLSNLSNFIC